MNLENENPYSAANYQAGNEKKERTWLPTCLFGCLGMFVVFILMGAVASWYLYHNARTIGANLVRKGVDSMVEAADLPADQKAEIRTQVDRVIDAFEENQITQLQAEQIIKSVTESNVPIMVLLIAAGPQYIAPSGLSDEEKENALQALQRIGRGVKDGSIEKSELKNLSEMVTVDKGRNRRDLKPTLTDDEIREAIAECTRIADAAEVPDESYEINLAEEIKSIIDQTLPNGNTEDPNTLDAEDANVNVEEVEVPPVAP